MALLGNAAMVLWYDVVPEAIDEHDEWHTREHFPERMAIPGFLRAHRWIDATGSPRYFVLYEVADIGVLSDAPYLERLNHPTEWTRATMPSFRGMTRGYCNVLQRHGTVLGSVAVTIRVSLGPGDEQAFAGQLEGTLGALVQRDGLTSAYFLESGPTPEMTNEQSIRGPDARVDQVVLVTGYSLEAVNTLASVALSAIGFPESGARSQSQIDVFQLACIADSR